MEQWVLDGRDIIRDRGFSRVPGFVEEDGYTYDASGGLRGLMKRVTVATKDHSAISSPSVATSNETKRDGVGSGNTHKDPICLGVGDESGDKRTEKKDVEPSSTVPLSPTPPKQEGVAPPSPIKNINYSKGLPHLYAECEVDYEYRYNGRIVDSNREDLALADLVAHLAKEEKEQERTRKLREELEQGVTPTVKSANSSPKQDELLTKDSKSDEERESNHSPFIASDAPVSFPAPKNLPKIGQYFPLELVLGAGQVTQAMDEALLSMYEGEETEWWVDPAFAFRDHGLRTKFGSIPADAAIQMKVKLLRFVNPMSSYERIQYATTLKNEANLVLQRALALEPSSTDQVRKGADTDTAKLSDTPQASPSSSSYTALLQDAVLAYNKALTKLGKTFVFKKKSANSQDLKNQQRVQAEGRGDTHVQNTPSQHTETCYATGENVSELKDPKVISVTNASGSTADEPFREDQIALDANLRAIILTNLSLCWFKRDDLIRSLDYADRAIKVNPLYGKAIYRKALIEERRCNFDEAIALLEGLLPQSSSASSSSINEPSKRPTGVVVADVEAKIKSLRETSLQQDAAQRRTFGGMFKSM